MKKFINVFAILLVVMIFVGGDCMGQPRGMYEITWEVATNGDKYEVFTWQGVDTTTCPFVENQDYKDSVNNIESYHLGTITGLITKEQMENNGEYTIAAVVAVNIQGTYGDLAKSNALKKSTKPGKSGKVEVNKKNP